MSAGRPAALTADAFVEALRAERSAAERQKILRSFRGAGDVLGVRMKTTFDLARASAAMPLDEVERLLERDHYEARIGAVSILDFKARSPKLSDDDRRDLYDLYLRRHDRIDTWDFVDRAAPRVIGGYLRDKPRDILDELARSDDMWRRRTAITATFLYLREGDVDDALRIAEILLHDPEELVNTSVGTALREVGTADPARQLAFLEAHAATMPRVTLRLAIVKLDPAEKKRLLALR